MNPRIVYFLIAIWLGTDTCLADVTHGADQNKAGTNLVDINLQLGIAEINSHNWDKAVEDFSFVIMEDPRNATAYELRGIALLAKGESDKGISDLSEVIRLEPTNYLALQNRGSAYVAKNRLDDAELDFSTCIRINPGRPEALKSRAGVYDYKGEFKKEIADLTQCLALDPKNVEALTHRAWAWAKENDFEKSIGDYREVISLQPTNDVAYNGLAWLYATWPQQKLRNGKKALECAKKACDLANWANASWIDTLAAAYAQMNDFEQAVKYEEQAIEKADPKTRNMMRRHLSLYEHREPIADGQAQ